MHLSSYLELIRFLLIALISQRIMKIMRTNQVRHEVYCVDINDKEKSASFASRLYVGRGYLYCFNIQRYTSRSKVTTWD